jgi:hypothetical protein
MHYITLHCPMHCIVYIYIYYMYVCDLHAARMARAAELLHAPGDDDAAGGGRKYLGGGGHRCCKRPFECNRVIPVSTCEAWNLENFIFSQVVQRKRHFVTPVPPSACLNHNTETWFKKLSAAWRITGVFFIAYKSLFRYTICSVSAP